jgi:DNA-binding transcriptional regulator LsrR (DeoR family)
MTERQSQLATMVEVAHLYYEENLSQQEIADRLNVSRSLIALLLKKAREQGIVQIQIRDPQNVFQDLALQLQERFHLKHAEVVSSAHLSTLLTRRAVGNAAAQFLDRNLQDGDILGLAWGRTILEVVNLLAPSKPRQIEVVPLLGESGYTSSYTQLNQIVLQAARAFNGTPYFLLVPMLVGSKELRDALLQDTSTKDVISRWERITYACVGIGAFPPVDGQIVYIGQENLPELIQREAVGDICARYFNSQGEFIKTEFNERLLGVSLDHLRRTKNVLAVAVGIEKARAVLGALRTQLITHLFVDEALARVLLQE